MMAFKINGALLVLSCLVLFVLSVSGGKAKRCAEKDKCEDIYTCDFEDLNHVYPWCIFTNNMPVPGPNWSFGTVTTPNGHSSNRSYTYVRTFNDTPELTVTLTTALTTLKDTPWCFSFTYIMTGIPGQLKVNVGKRGKPLHQAWVRYGDQGHAWLSAEIDIPRSSDGVIEIVASMNAGQPGIIAVDDIKLQCGKCVT